MKDTLSLSLKKKTLWGYVLIFRFVQQMVQEKVCSHHTLKNVNKGKQSSSLFLEMTTNSKFGE